MLEEREEKLNSLFHQIQTLSLTQSTSTKRPGTSHEEQPEAPKRARSTDILSSLGEASSLTLGDRTIRPLTRRRVPSAGPSPSDTRAQDIRSTQSIQGDLDPPGLANAKKVSQQVWRQIELPNNWTITDSKLLLSNFEWLIAQKGPSAKYYLPYKSFNTIAKNHDKKPSKEFCFKRHIHHDKPDFVDGPDQKCLECKQGKRADPICVDVFFVNENTGEYDPESTDKRWRLKKRE